MSPPADGSVCWVAWREVPFAHITSPYNMIRLTLLYFLASLMLQIPYCTTCMRCLPVASFNERKNSSVSSDGMAHCSNDCFYCKLLELKDHLQLKQLGHWNYADNKNIIAPSVPFYSLLRETLLLHFPQNT